MGLYSMVVGTIHGNTFNKNYMIATVLARDQIERILHDDYTAVVAANYPQEDYTTMAGYEQFQRTVTIDVDTPNPDAKTVTVSVAWRNSTGATRNVRLRTIIVLLTP